MQDKNTFSVNSTEPFAIFVDSDADNKTGVTGVAVELATNFELRKSGGSFASISPTISEIGDGHYEVTLLAAHRDTSGPLVMRTTATGANSVEIHHRIVDPAEVIRDAIGLAAASLDSDLADLNTALAGKAEPGDEMTLSATTLTALFEDVDTQSLVDSINDLFNDASDVNVQLLATQSGQQARDLLLASDIGVQLARIHALLEDVDGDRWTEKSLEAVPVGALSEQNIDDIVSSLTAVSSSIKNAADSVVTGYSSTTWVQPLEEVSDTNVLEFLFALKRDADDADSEALLLVSSEDGLVVLNGSPAPDSTLASLSFSETTLTLNVSDNAMVNVRCGKYYDGWKAIKASESSLLRGGKAIIRPGVIDEVS